MSMVYDFLRSQESIAQEKLENLAVRLSDAETKVELAKNRIQHWNDTLKEIQEELKKYE